MESTEQIIFYAIILFIFLDYLWGIYLLMRQHKVYLKTSEIPTELIGIMSQKTFDKARRYAIHKSRYHMFYDTYTFILTMIYLFIGCMPKLWKFTGDIIQRWGYESGDMIHNALFLFVGNTAFLILHFPFKLYYHFILEEKHGFNNQTVLFYTWDKIKRHMIQQVLLIPIMCGVMYTVKLGGDYFVFYAWFIVMLGIFFVLTIQPDFILPLFDKYVPLPDGDLKTEIEKMAASIGFPLYKILIIEGSKRSCHSNAYFFGIFNKKRIVIYDTLIKDYVSPKAKSVNEKKIGDEKEEEKEKENGNDNENENENGKEKNNENDNENEKEKEKANGKKTKDKKGCELHEILAILAHEFGHWKHSHIFKRLIITQVNILVVCIIFACVFKQKSLYRAFGFYDSEPLVIGLTLVLQFVCVPYVQLVAFTYAYVGRRFEFEADRFAKSLGRAHFLKCALIKVNSDNLSFPVFDPLFSAWHNDHPSLLERLQALDKAE